MLQQRAVKRDKHGTGTIHCPSSPLLIPSLRLAFMQVDALLLLAQEEERGMRQQRAVERLQAEVADLRSSLAQVRCRGGDVASVLMV